MVWQVVALTTLRHWQHYEGCVVGRPRNPVVEGLAARMTAAAAQHKQNSLSNGCLLRLTPLAIWSSRQPTDVVAANAAAETSLTHPQQTAQVASAAYCIAIAHLINYSKDAQGAIAAANTWLQNSLAAALQQVTPPGGTHSSTSGGSASSAQPGSQASCEHDVSADSAADVKPKAAAAWEAVLSWLGEAQQDGPGPEVYRAAGFMKWGFVHAFRALALTLLFEEALRQLHGGDKNTNAVIVGGLLGAYWGAEGISATLTGPVLCRCSSSVGIKRPEFLQTGQLPELFEKLWAAASS